MNPRIKKLVDSFYDFRQKFTLGVPELVFGIYSIIATATRPSIPTLLLAMNVNEFETMYISLAVSFSITCLFLLFSIVKKIDWYGKKETGLIFFIINKFNNKKTLLILFFGDSFLFFIYHQKNNKIYTTIPLLILSSIAVTITWEIFGILLIKLIGLIHNI